jgi:hypothetical protein
MIFFTIRCYSLENSKWVVAPNTTKQGYAAAVQLKEGKLLVTGGYDSDGLDRQTEGYTNKITYFNMIFFQQVLFSG